MWAGKGEPLVCALSGGKWSIGQDGESRARKWVAALESLKFTRFEDVAAHFGHSKSWGTKVKAEAHALNLLTHGAQMACLERAKELQEALTQAEEELPQEHTEEDGF